MAILSSLLVAAVEIVDIVLTLYVWALIVGALLSWLVAFDVLNTRNRFVQVVGDVTYRITEPALRRIRRFVPVVGGLDLSPIVLILIVMFLQSFLRHLVMSL